MVGGGVEEEKRFDPWDETSHSVAFGLYDLAHAERHTRHAG